VIKARAASYRGIASNVFRVTQLLGSGIKMDTNQREGTTKRVTFDRTLVLGRSSVSSSVYKEELSTSHKKC
jgi:hypothetical protein